MKHLDLNNNNNDNKTANKLKKCSSARKTDMAGKKLCSTLKNPLTSYSTIPLLLISLIVCLISSPQLANCSSSLPPNHDDKLTLNYLLFNQREHGREENSSRIDELLANSNHSHASDAVNLQLANSIWFKMSQNAHEFARRRVAQVKPIVNKFLKQANVSEQCEHSINLVMERISEMDLWAMQSEYQSDPDLIKPET